MKFFALNTDVSSDSETALNAVVILSKKHVLTHNIDFSSPHTKYQYTCTIIIWTYSKVGKNGNILDTIR